MTTVKRLETFAITVAFITAIVLITSNVVAARQREQPSIAKVCAHEMQWRDTDHLRGCR